MARKKWSLAKKGVVTLATVGLTGATASFSLAAQKPTLTPAQEQAVKIAPQPTLTLERTSLAKLGNNLFSSQIERQKFLSNPNLYAEALLGAKLDAASKNQLDLLKNMVASGICCRGCGCGIPPSTVSLPAK